MTTMLRPAVQTRPKNPPCSGLGENPDDDFTHRAEDGNKKVPDRVPWLVHAFCRTCPVRRECLAALDPNADGGIYGGRYFVQASGELVELPIPSVY